MPRLSMAALYFKPPVAAVPGHAGLTGLEGLEAAREAELKRAIMLALERAVALVEAHPGWRARVVYGDTDSLFVHLPGRTRDEAFVVGKRGLRTGWRVKDFNRGRRRVLEGLAGCHKLGSVA